jgi:pimeloyl-ACP methyl ester carboxylesterase
MKASVSRRQFLGTGITAGVVAAGMVPLSAAADDDEDEDRRIVAREHSVPAPSAKDGSPLRLALFEKFDREREPDRQAMTGRIVLVLHGATTSGRVNNDVQVPGVGLKDSFSLMDQFALRGYDVFTLDYQNYGRSDHHDCGLCVNTVAATRDIEAAVNFILQLRGVSKLHLIGWSWGGATGGLFTQHHPDQVNRLVLYAPVLDLQKDFSKATSSPPTFANSPVFPVPTAQFRDNTVNNAAALKGFFHPTARIPAVVDAYVKAALAVDSKSPNGVLVDWRTDPLKMDPTKIVTPTLVIGGSDDDRAALMGPLAGPNALGFFTRLAVKDKKFVNVGNAGHGLFLEQERAHWYRAVFEHLGAGNRALDDN